MQPKNQSEIKQTSRLKNWLRLFILFSFVLLITAAGAFFFLISQPKAAAPVAPATNTTATPETPQDKPTEPYQGVLTPVAGQFSIKVPNGWTASISQSPAFTAILFSKLNELDTLTYNASSVPVITTGGAPNWDGLTEHFFVLLPASSQRFNPSAHREISSTTFQFNDGHIGTKYDVVKHAEEAASWGGLKKDTEWQGRTYIYNVDGQQIEAHLALYPSSNIDIPFYEEVVRTIELIK